MQVQAKNPKIQMKLVTQPTEGCLPIQISQVVRRDRQIRQRVPPRPVVPNPAKEETH